MDLQKKQFSMEYAGRQLTLEVSRIAEQANAAVMGSYGDTTVLATVVMGEKDKESSYFPLTVDYEERFYAVGKILGSRFVRREGKASEEAVLSGRVIDRTIRPLFDGRMRRDVQVVVTILSLDEEDDLDFLALLTASTALSISDIPWAGPVGGVKIVRKDGKILINPKNSEINAALPAGGWAATGGDYQLFAAGPKGKINMIEAEGMEATEADVMSGFELAQVEIDRFVDFQNDIVKQIGKKKQVVNLATIDAALKERVVAFLKPKCETAVFIKNTDEREAAFATIRTELMATLTDLVIDAKVQKAIADIEEEVVTEVVHAGALDRKQRPDGRGIEEVRELGAQVGLLKRTHGSALFVRGTTQSLAVATIAPPGAEQLIETMSFSGKKRFMLHYNFPQYSVGETGPFRGPGRREIGHGALAEKALRNMMPAKADFPYTVRVVSEILSSNGSSSMATVCASTLAMMDAGIPIKKPIAGIAMGLMSDDKGRYQVLTDLQGYEDHYGDMDFKVAGSREGITAVQMDVKIGGLTGEMLKQALKQAQEARMKILEVILATIPAYRPQLSPLAPLIMTIKIDPSQIGMVIGSGGKTINGIIESTGCLAIDIDDDGLVFVAGKDRATTQAAYNAVLSIVKEYKIGDIVEGPVVKMLEFGAIVQIDSGHDGMIHISELKDGFVKKVDEVVKMGDVVKAKVVKVDPSGKIGLSLKAMAEKKA
jgi:polyribonucleotide nucleotidyltransferase